MSASTSSKVTTDHDAIRHWAEERGAKPVLAATSDGDPGKVRLDFPGSRDTSLRETSWDEWFLQFDKSNLALLYQQHTPDGEHSCFCKIVRREKADEVERAVGGRGRSASRRGPSRADKASGLRREAEAQTTSQADKTLLSAGAIKAPEKSVPRKPRAPRSPGEQIGPS
jgi:hypothetical protein